MRSRTRFHVVASRVHKWLALIIGAQLLIWFASGVIMSFLPIEEVRGEHLVDRETVMPIPAGMALIAPQRIVAQSGAPVEAMTWHMLDSRPIAEVTTAKGVKLFDAATGAALPPVDAALATKIARTAWKSDDKPRSTATRVTAESPEYRAALPAWRIAFADSERQAFLWRLTPGESPLFETAHGGYMISSGAFTSWIGRTTKISTAGGFWPSLSAG